MKRTHRGGDAFGRTAGVQALASVVVAHLVAKRGRLHTLCERQNWRWSETEGQSHQLDSVDHALTALGLFDTIREGDQQ
jgi:hypothetical protein